MKILRWLAAGLVWIVAGVVGLVGGLLCVTILLLPLGIPLLMVSRRLFSLAGRLWLPAGVRHPVRELDKKGSRWSKNARGSLAKGAERVGSAAPSQPGKKARKMRKKAEQKLGRRNRLGFKRP
jgi:hypothetical protein